MLARSNIVSKRVVMAEGSKFPELAETFYHHPESLSRKLGDYL